MSETLDVKSDACAPEFTDYFAQSAAFYRFLGSVFVRELTEEQIEALTGISLECEDDGSDLARGLKGVRTYLNRRGGNARQDLAVDYARVFLAAGVYEGDTAVPYESVYTSPEKILMQDSRDEVVRIYCENGLAVDPDLNVPEDHLGFELEFMAHLCERIAEEASDDRAVAKLLKTQKQFVREHLLNWVPELRDRVREIAELRFYPAIMDLTVGYLKENVAVIEETEERL